MPKSGILQANHHSIDQQIFSNLRQNQQGSLPQVGCARVLIPSLATTSPVP